MSSSVRLRRFLRAWSTEDLELLVDACRHNEYYVTVYSQQKRFSMMASALAELSRRRAENELQAVLFDG
jgi:hypothetical protein